MAFWWERLWEDENFQLKTAQRYTELRSTIFSEEHIYSIIDSIVTYLRPAVDRNFNRWTLLGNYVWPNYYVFDIKKSNNIISNKKIAESISEKIKKSISIPVTVKCRIGVDDMDEKKDLNFFIKVVNNEGCDAFIIHARKAWLNGLSPKENRNIPPLDYKRVYRLKEKFPELEIILNGGLSRIHNSVTHLGYVNGIMMGRGVYQDPFQIRDVDELFYDQRAFNKSRLEVFKELMPYLIEQGNKGIKINLIMKILKAVMEC